MLSKYLSKFSDDEIGSMGLSFLHYLESSQDFKVLENKHFEGLFIKLFSMISLLGDSDKFYRIIHGNKNIDIAALWTFNMVKQYENRQNNTWNHLNPSFISIDFISKLLNLSNDSSSTRLLLSVLLSSNTSIYSSSNIFHIQFRNYISSRTELHQEGTSDLLEGIVATLEKEKSSLEYKKSESNDNINGWKSNLSKWSLNDFIMEFAPESASTHPQIRRVELLSKFYNLMLQESDEIFGNEEKFELLNKLTAYLQHFYWEMEQMESQKNHDNSTSSTPTLPCTKVLSFIIKLLKSFPSSTLLDEMKANLCIISMKFLSKLFKNNRKHNGNNIDINDIKQSSSFYLIHEQYFLLFLYSLLPLLSSPLDNSLHLNSMYDDPISTGNSVLSSFFTSALRYRIGSPLVMKSIISIMEKRLDHQEDKFIKEWNGIWNIVFDHKSHFKVDPIGSKSPSKLNIPSSHSQTYYNTHISDFPLAPPIPSQNVVVVLDEDQHTTIKSHFMLYSFYIVDLPVYHPPPYYRRNSKCIKS